MEKFLENPRARRHEGAFTLIELGLVILLLGVMTTLVGFSTGTFAYWKEEAFLRRLVETIEFLHTQAVSDQAYYRLEMDFGRREQPSFFSVGVVKQDEDLFGSGGQAVSTEDIGIVSTELYFFLHPSVGTDGTYSIIPPPSFPSLFEPVYFPPGMTLQRVRTSGQLAAREKDDKAYLLFSPRGFSSFAVLHLTMTSGAPITILVNPFTGLTEVYREFRDFEWAYGRKKES